MLGFSIRVLLFIALTFAAFTGQAQPVLSSCQTLFSPIFKQEPYLAAELHNLQALCEQDTANKNSEYWVCIHKRMQQGPMNFQRLVLSAHVCDGQDAGLVGPD